MKKLVIRLIRYCLRCVLKKALSLLENAAFNNYYYDDETGHHIAEARSQVYKALNRLK